MDPLVVTLAVDDDAQAFFDAERTRWFPPGRTQVGAHLTLFHAVPGELEADVHADLGEQAGPAFALDVAAVMPLGRGVAYRVDSAELVARHRALQQRWWPHLTRQDQQGLRPHVTVQNKVTPARARDTLATVQAGFRPFTATAVGFVLWRYVGGPWEQLARVPFPIVE